MQREMATTKNKQYINRECNYYIVRSSFGEEVRGLFHDVIRKTGISKSTMYKMVYDGPRAKKHWSLIEEIPACKLVPGITPGSETNV